MTFNFCYFEHHACVAYSTMLQASKQAVKLLVSYDGFVTLKLLGVAAKAKHPFFVAFTICYYRDILKRQHTNH